MTWFSSSSPLRTLRTQGRARVEVHLLNGPSPWLRYVGSAAVLCLVTGLLYRFVFLRLDQLACLVQVRKAEAAVAARASRGAVASEAGVQVFSATDAGKIKRFGPGTGATRRKEKK
jgi:hypothetical protein